MLFREPSFGATLFRKLFILSALALAFGLQTASAAVATNFHIVNHKTGQPLSLYDYQGTVVLLDFWAYWCGPCQLAASDIEPNITKYYRSHGGNSNGVPVTVISISIDTSNPTAENNYIQTFGLELVGDDGSEVAYGPYNAGGIPQFAVINGVTNSANYGAWQILSTPKGYATNSTVPLLKSLIDSVRPAQAAYATISTAASPTNGGTVSGAGSYPVGSQAILSATASNGWVFTGWSDGNSQNPRTITVPSGGASFTADFAQTGSLQVTLSPAEAVSAGAQWRVDSGAWRNSAATVANLSVGNHIVSFAPVSGWITPANQTVSVSANSTATASGTYVVVPLPQVGSLEVTISPAGAVGAGAQWQVDGGKPQSSGMIIANLRAGVHLVSFTPISGWTTPAPLTVYVSANSTTTTNGTYLLQFGSLQVTISPPGAVTNGAQWQVDGGTYQNSGATVSNLSVGSHKVSFSAVSGWTTPATQTVSVSTNATATANGTYVQQFGSLQATISPPEAITAGAQWQVDGGTWTNSGATVAHLSVTNHTVNFYPISNWNTPASQTVSINVNGVTKAAGAYVAQTGSLMVTLNPAEAVAAGAKWRVDSGTWQDSGATVTNLLVGQRTVSFNPISGWTNPPNLTVTITNGQTNILNASYLDVSKPTLAITSPAKNQRWSNSTFTVTGTAKDNLAVSNVFYSLNGGGWSNAVTGNHWTNWSATETPAPGPNTNAVYAVDTSGNKSPVTNVVFLYIPSATLTLQTNGRGTITLTPAGNANLLAIGTNYTLTAVAGKNWLFSNWVGGTISPYAVLSTTSNYTFRMQSNLVLAANFATNLFLAAQGNYYGLFAPADAPRRQTNSGSFTLTVGSNGVFSGKLYLASQTNSLSGKFDVSGYAQVVLTPHGQRPLTTSLQLDLADQTVQGSVTDGSFVAILNGDQAVFSSAHKATNYQGRYTLVIPGVSDSTIGPFGTSYGTVTVDASGNIAFVGSLADGTSVSQSSGVSKDGNWPFYVPLYNGAGSVWGTNYFTNQTIVSAPTLSWINATNSAKTAVYRSGFTNQEAALIGSFYTSTNKPLLSLTNFHVTLESVNPPISITNQISWASNNTIAVPRLAENTNGLTLTNAAATGTISGSFLNPTNARQRINFNGVLMQDRTNAAGYFLGPNQSGALFIAP